jgi:hypothetical protein
MFCDKPFLPLCIIPIAIIALSFSLTFSCAYDCAAFFSEGTEKKISE